MGLDVSHVVPIAKTHAVEQLEYFPVEELSISPAFIEKHKALLAEVHDEEAKVTMTVLYVMEKGYQRKGMSSLFYKDFQNGRPYFDLLSVKKAYEYLKDDHISTLEALQQNFQKNFIENFIEGESIFYASW
ncbi:hypothetical protein LRS06_22250 [Hymenobacter sp. J193]|uniref:hypothetical protein n=1 Tax=Hymenobacter sp. J193 TaxID=2898429 RepID=UPI002151763D|nr:hypothetical protein [Hymenobacter sp. J193]MCR5890296.1 hypothetical protein [Hymenobacter sp. J193]MCR5890453.1 hypothetical protein [Hymenobacter sp. J193]